eukprot:TRINITY_DN4809_c0_g1_i2.p1 TRINITY_DN4809_c0_g1~~TRINITY_DN4809_c0_g1_i2.p1  ORF type:complete len:962 (+),score=384.99 TRINITY_DN4809_c0_g1_i2:162-3047(+)
MSKQQDIKKKMLSRSERVKSCTLHPREPWVLCSLFTGQVTLWNYETQQMVKSFEVVELPIRCVKFITRMNWFICGCDDMRCRVMNYNTMERVKEFDAHQDYIRGIAVHDTQPYVITSSDDMTIKLWNWEKGWTNTMMFEGHVHYVMAVTFNPKDPNTFASASLDRTVKVWNVAAYQCNFTLEGHTHGVNCVEYYHGGDKPYLLSGSDDRTVRVWDYQTKSCVQVLSEHSNNVSCCLFFPGRPLLVTGSEDESVKFWNLITYRLEASLDYGLHRVWCLSVAPGSNKLAIGCDKGTVVLRVGKDEPVFSMDTNGKVMFAVNHDIVQVTVKGNVDADAADGDKLHLPSKEMGSCETVPKRMVHNVTGQYVAVLFDGEFTINSALAWRPKNFGSAQDFVWGVEPSTYAILCGPQSVKVHKNFKERSHFRSFLFNVDKLFGGPLLGARGDGQVTFFDWEDQTVIRQIAVQPRSVVWNDTGDMVALIADSSFYILRYNKQAVVEFMQKGEPMPDDGVEEAFDLIDEVEDKVRQGAWVGGAFLFVNRQQRLNYFMGGEVYNLAVLERPMYLLGYVSRDNRVYLTDKDRQIVSYQLFQAVIDFQSAVARGELEFAKAEYMSRIPDSQKGKVAHFLDKAGYKELALAMSPEDDHRFDLAVALHRIDVVREIAAAEKGDKVAARWKQLGDLALAHGHFEDAAVALEKGQDLGGLLLLHSSREDRAGIERVADLAEEHQRINVAFTASMMLGDHGRCVRLLLETDRAPEAALFARSRCPERLPEVLVRWKKSLGASKLAEAIADPEEFPNLFPEISDVFAKPAAASPSSSPRASGSPELVAAGSPARSPRAAGSPPASPAGSPAAAAAPAAPPSPVRAPAHADPQPAVPAQAPPPQPAPPPGPPPGPPPKGPPQFPPPAGVAAAAAPPAGSPPRARPPPDDDPFASDDDEASPAAAKPGHKIDDDDVFSVDD